MAVLMEKAIFFHNPKCGGTWVRRALKNAGIQCWEIGPEENYSNPAAVHHWVGQVPFPLLSFTFIRHPVDWLKSFWRFRQQHGWRKGDTPLDEKPIDNFPQFVEHYLTHHSGYITSVFNRYIQHSQLIGKQENLTEDLISFLKQTGENFNEDKIRQTPPVNCSPSHIQAEYADGQKERLITAEKEIISSFYFLS